MKPLFYKGQIVTCIDSSTTNGRGFDEDVNWPLIEGKNYTIENPDYKSNEIKDDVCAVTLFNVWGVFDQERFIPLEADRQADEEIHQALKGNKILAD